MTAALMLLALLVSFFMVFFIYPWLTPGSGRIPTSRKEVRRQIAFIETQLKFRSRADPVDRRVSRILRLVQLRALEKYLYLKPKDRLQSKGHLRSKQTHSAHFLLAIAVRLLPHSQRARYLEEFRAELLELPRGMRLRHALSLLRGVFVLRLRRGPKNKAANVRRAKG